ncbi:tripartite tricarboxylate transporter substrate binding protein [Rhizobium ruizarguesonis]|uniref:Tripartite tricarboxylate transporter substrate binding protein n=1 Tax=Rhizobium ruizarguesonis TaxID=2081791 RepID=A0ABY1X5E7_9HYPH|nr:tripartite tricarboxylate transporter substrate binding protein [Rhizobium ruizarguesonis]TAU17173.1 tripartite tricarboxylate transporter substrate binding protein [Rhizobium ruizarguesonis]TAU57561.1 tripartite tricarboxylate transporter substrate binding protein [Rhizobium ruizarguesonis]TAU59381.1 tripartite tricarboxylate transporter substrate binding protein [Rhizobium ruizarguesonis]TAV03572.1 tripartite tricarboxylate transporter substrate binding protein [Rhizobium ruizarguesonis]T
MPNITTIHAMTRRGALLAMAAAVVIAGGVAHAAEWVPQKPIRLVVPYGPGGSSDIIARVMASEMSKGLGQQIVVENKPGASGVVAMQDVARSDPDGYTIVLGHVGTLAVNPSMLSSIPYDTDKDFVPITLIAKVPVVFVIHSDVPAKNFKEFIALAKSEPGKLSYGSAGNGSAGHLAFEQLKLVTQTDILHIPYKGTGAQLTDLLGHRTDAASAGLPPFLPHLKSGKLIALAVGSAERLPLIPDVPTVVEEGYPGFESSQWFGFLAPAGTPKETIDRIQSEAVKALKTASVSERLKEDASVAVGSTPVEFQAFITAERTRWGEIVRKANLKAE